MKCGAMANAALCVFGGSAEEKDENLHAVASRNCWQREDTVRIPPRIAHFSIAHLHVTRATHGLHYTPHGTFQHSPPPLPSYIHLHLPCYPHHSMTTDKMPTTCFYPHFPRCPHPRCSARMAICNPGKTLQQRTIHTPATAMRPRQTKQRRLRRNNKCA